MAVIKGISGAAIVILDSYNVPYAIRSFTISNIDTPTINVSIYISDGVTDYIITALDFTLKGNQAYVRDSPIYVDKNNYIKIVTKGSIGYYFSID